MKGKIEDFYVNRNGKQMVILSVEGNFGVEYDKYKDADIDVSIKKWHQKRSDASNRLLWVLVDKIAVATKVAKTEVYKNAIKDIGGTSEIVCVKDAAVDKLCAQWSRNGIGWQTDTFPSKIQGCTNVILYYGSSTYTTDQMCQLLDYLLIEAEGLGINTDTPERAAYWSWVEENVSN